MFERFTTQARSAITFAEAEGRRLHHDRIGTEHVLVGVLCEPETTGARALTGLGVDPAVVRDEVARGSAHRRSGFATEDAEALRSLGIDLDEVRRAAEETFGPGALEQTGETAAGHMPFTAGSKRALQLALREAIRLGHREIGTEHLVLGLVRDRCSTAARILADAGLEPERVREAVEREIERPG